MALFFVVGRIGATEKDGGKIPPAIVCLRILLVVVLLPCIVDGESWFNLY
ncbi:MAG: hypothetical protein K0R28_6980 [Paenibacillus sp.]|nr:hypothetical protein [Paenibacillus sp.]